MATDLDWQREPRCDGSQVRPFETRRRLQKKRTENEGVIAMLLAL